MDLDSYLIFESYLDNKALPPLPNGERLVRLITADGNKQIVSFGDKYWTGFPGDPACIAYPVNGAWSHGLAPKGSKIEELINLPIVQIVGPK